uniref:Helitron helicase-like domain-containing protein n=1 Tax=Meloidogyne javanica TaxID=6303 RepID=A0A915MJ38_MELJA
MRGNIRIVLDDIDDLPSTSQNTAQNNSDDMQRESLEKRNQRLEKDRERKRRNRENESQTRREERLEQDMFRHRIRRENDDQEENEQRLERDMIRKRIRRENESVEERDMRLDQRNLRYIRDEIRLFAAGDHRNVIVNRLGRMNVECTHCGALHFPEGKIGNKGNSFNTCCHHGKVKLNMIPEDNFPVLLKNLNLNSSVSMASMNPLRYRYPSNRGPYCFRICGQIYHKLNLALNPDDGDEPAYGQVFIVDTEEALSAMNRANPVINQRYNVPRANEVAAVYVPGADGEMPNAKIVVREKGKELRILDNTNQLVSPMTYPLFFPRGTLGWHPDIRQENSFSIYFASDGDQLAEIYRKALPGCNVISAKVRETGSFRHYDLQFAMGGD